MFRLQQNVPDVYPQQSRDFQIFCRAYDSLFNGVKYGVDSLSHTKNTMECNNSLLGLLANKLGLFTTLNVPDNDLRYILCAFPYLIRYKGSYQAIEYAVRVFQRMAMISNLGYTIYTDTDNRQIIITFSDNISDDTLLYELMSYILPTGYTCVYTVFSGEDSITRIVTSHEATYEIFEDPLEMAKIYYQYNSSDTPYYQNTIGNMIIPAKPKVVDIRPVVVNTEIEEEVLDESE